MVHHQHPAEPVGQVGQGLGLLHRRGQRLLDQHVQAGLQAPPASGKWVETGVAMATASSGKSSNSSSEPTTVSPGYVRRDRCLPGRAGVAHRGHLGQRAGGEVADQVRAPVAAADHADAKAIHCDLK